MNMSIKPIKTARDHDKALTLIKALWDRKDQASRAALDVMSTLVQVYEDEHHPIEPVSAIDAIKFAMEQNGYEQTDLAKLLGSRSRAAEILNGKRGINLRMIRKLHEEWGVPLASLVQDDSAGTRHDRRARPAKRRKDSSSVSPHRRTA